MPMTFKTLELIVLAFEINLPTAQHQNYPLIVFKGCSNKNN
jgi:hypothetical protein